MTGDLERRPIDRVAELEAVLRAIADHDWEALLRIGGPIVARGVRLQPEDFALEGTFEADARYVYPVRDLLITQASRRALDGGES